MARKVPDSPQMRYLAQLNLGAEPELAMDVVASSYGLSTNVVRLTGDGQPKHTPIRWTLKQINDLLFLCWDYDRSPPSPLSSRTEVAPTPLMPHG